MSYVHSCSVPHVYPPVTLLLMGWYFPYFPYYRGPQAINLSIVRLHFLQSYINGAHLGLFLSQLF